MTTTVGFSIPLLNDAVAAVASRLRASVVAIRSRAGTGSGTAWPGGLIITNNHVVHGDRARVEAADGAVYTATLVAREPERDLASLRLDGATLPAVETRDAASLRTGELVLAVGHPWGGSGDATLGIVAHCGNAATLPGATDLPSLRSGERAERRAVYADVRLAPGNSGGPLADAHGRVVGINSMIAYGMAVAVPSEVVADFIAHGGAERGMLGISVLAVPLPVGEGAGSGLLVTEVTPGGAADAAGLIPGDIVIAVDGVAGELDALGARLRQLRTGRPVRLDLLRGGQRRTLDISPTAVAA